VPNATYENFHQGQWRAALSERSLTSYGLAFGLIVSANVGVARVMRRAKGMCLLSDFPCGNALSMAYDVSHNNAVPRRNYERPIFVKAGHGASIPWFNTPWLMVEISPTVLSRSCDGFALNFLPFDCRAGCERRCCACYAPCDGHVFVFAFTPAYGRSMAYNVSCNTAVPNATYENFHQGQWRAALSERSLTSNGLAFGLIVSANVGVARVMRRAKGMCLLSDFPCGNALSMAYNVSRNTALLFVAFATLRSMPATNSIERVSELHRLKSDSFRLYETS